MNSLSSSRSHPSRIITHGYQISQNTRAAQSVRPLSPIVTGTICLGLALSVLLVALFGSQPITIENFTSDFHAGVDGMAALIQPQNASEIESLR